MHIIYSVDGVNHFLIRCEEVKLLNQPFRQVSQRVVEVLEPAVSVFQIRLVNYENAPAAAEASKPAKKSQGQILAGSGKNKGV